MTPDFRAEGAGARVRRIIGNEEIRRLDPFLMLDFFSLKLPAGFPDHPHRGFETVTYLQKGTIYHEDFRGNKGILEPGDIQWMSAGKGIVHAEMPGSFDEITEGFQLWINLRATNKMQEASYQEYKSDKLPVKKENGVTAKVIAGEAIGLQGPIKAKTPAYFMDISVEEGKQFSQQIPAQWNSLIYVYQGSCEIGEQKSIAKQNQAVIFEQDQSEILQINALKDGCKFVLLAGQPLLEKISQYGPFVMNTQDEIRQAFEDYQFERNGFENAQRWESQIQHMSKRSKSVGK